MLQVSPRIVCDVVMVVVGLAIDFNEFEDPGSVGVQSHKITMERTFGCNLALFGQIVSKFIYELLVLVYI